MTELQPRLEAWTRAGLIDEAQAAAILDFEGASPHAATRDVRQDGRRGLGPRPWAMSAPRSPWARSRC